MKPGAPQRRRRRSSHRGSSNGSHDRQSAFPLQPGSSCTFAVTFMSSCTNGVDVSAETAIGGGPGDNRTLPVYGYESGC